MTTIRVTEERIAHGKPLECTLCPVALAIQSRLIPGVVAYVSQTDVVIGEARQGGGRMASSIQLQFPEWVQKKIDRFDAGGGMEPFEFRLDIPDYLLSH